MAYPNSNYGREQFFAFQSQLHQSAMYYSNIALQQMRIGYQNQIPWNDGFNYSNPNYYSFANMPARSDNKGTKKFKASKTLKATEVPVGIITVNVEDYDEANKKAATGNKRVRKVNFAHPLSVVKIKSPTPMQSLEDFGGMMGACTSSQATWGTYAQNQHQMNPFFYHSDSDSNLENFPTPICSFGSSNIPSLPNANPTYDYGVYGDASSGHQCRKKRRRKRKKHGKDDTVEDFGISDDASSVPIDSEDPYAIYEVPINDEDYEFISDVRLCVDDDLTKFKSDSSSLSNLEDSDDEKVKVEIGTEGKKDLNALIPDMKDDSNIREEMKALYGEMGSERIYRMEAAIEKHYNSEV